MSENSVSPPPKLGRNHVLHAALRHHSIIDDITMLAMRRRRPPRPDAELSRIEHEIEQSVAHYRELGWFDRPELAYAAPPPPTTYDSVPERAARFHYQHITFASDYQPPADDPAGARWLSYESNRTVHAWVMRHPGPQRPWLVCLHGTGMGRPLMDLGLFRANWLYRHMGVNVACPVLPLHGPRRASVPADVHYPSEDALHNFHGTLQAVWDVRRMLASLRSQGNTRLGVLGISLGGLIAGLVGDLDPDLNCVILGAPVAELGALIERHKAQPFDPGEARNLELARQLDRIISPLSLSPKTPRDRRFIYAGIVDKMVHHRYHGGRIWEHWERPEALWYNGGHSALGYSRDVARFIEQAMRATDVVGADAA